MAGSSVYGAGYHQGSQDGFQNGFQNGLGKGTGVGAAGVLVLAGAAFAGKLGIEKLKSLAAARHEKKLLAMEQPDIPMPDESAANGNDGADGADS